MAFKRNNKKCKFLISSNAHADVTNFKFADLGKTQKSNYLENETQIFL